MKNIVESRIKESITVKKAFLKHAELVAKAAKIIINSYKNGGKLVIFGNGGSAADAQHIAAEFIGRFAKERKSLPAIALSTDTSILTSIGNDYGFEYVFARQIEGLLKKGDIAIGISTSGNSPNVINGLKKAKEIGAKTIALTGGNGGKLKESSDICIIVPSFVTARIQECHITIGHIICELVEVNF